SLVLSGRLVTESPKLVQHEAFDLGGGQRRCWTGMPAALLGFRAQVIAIATAAVLGGMGRCHGAVTSHATQQALQQGIGRAARHGSAGTAVLLEEGLDLVPKSDRHDGRVLAVMDIALVPDLAYVEDIGEQFVQARLGERPAAAPGA